jgi:hypothetical protein
MPGSGALSHLSAGQDNIREPVMVRNAPAEILAAKGSLDLPKIVKG